MLLRRRPSGPGDTPVQPCAGFEHLEPRSLSVLRWLIVNRIDFVLVGPVAEAIRGDTTVSGPVAIVPAPYARNYERLTRALVAERAGLRSDRGLGNGPDRGGPDPVTLSADKLARGRRWMLSFGGHDLDIERAGHRSGGAQPGAGVDGADSPVEPGGAAGARAPRYQDLLYESNRFEVADGVSIEVAAPEDLVHYDHVRRTGVAPEFTVARLSSPVPGDEAPGDEAPGDGASVAGVPSDEATLSDARGGGAPAGDATAGLMPAEDAATAPGPEGRASGA